MTLLDTVQAASARLQQAGVSFGHGTTNAWDEAAWLVLWRLGLPLDTPLDDGPDAQRRLSADEQASVQALIEQRITSRRPAAYLTGEAWLQGVPFFVDERAIVPRSLIAEVLAEGLLDPWLPEGAQRVLDLCTGNGSLACLAAMAWPQMQVDGADISTDALAVAARNVQRHELGARVHLLAGDGLAAVAGRRYDLILCNPPYVNSASMAVLPPEFQAEPALALAGGADGMDFIRGLLQQAPIHLNEGAVLVLEIGHERAHFEAAFPRLQPLWLPTSAGDDQVLLLERAALA
ncbi:protein-(glutamine-N5) methyltransferase, ribosomal protein L3-specific [Burkholderiales bacterium JOSHI_001]|nr:protein-(glutamine-N5) methyltransferase, ribosomal protein L3-specific [Burkholderiales bacterium JOSHI_001]